MARLPIKEVQGATVRREANILASLFTVARKEWKWIKESPMADLTLPHHQSTVIDELPKMKLIDYVLQQIGIIMFQ